MVDSGALALCTTAPACVRPTWLIQRRHEFYQAATYCNDVALLELNASARVGRPIGHILEPGQFTFTPESNFTALGFGAVG